MSRLTPPAPPANDLLSVQSEVLRNTPAGDKEKVSKAMHRVMDHNQLFYCTNNEVVVGQMAKTNMDPIHAEVRRMSSSWYWTVIVKHVVASSSAKGLPMTK